MLKASPIVCVIDLSATSQKNLPAAAKLAEEMGAKLVIFYPALFRNWSIYGLLVYTPKDETAKAVRRAEPIVREIMSRSPEVEWELKVEAGDAAWMVKSLMKDPEIELVISTRHRGGLRVLKAPLGARGFTDTCRKVLSCEPSSQV